MRGTTPAQRLALASILLGPAVAGCNLVLGIGELSSTGKGTGGAGGGATSSSTASGGGGGASSSGSSSGSGGATSSSSGSGGGGGTVLTCDPSCQHGDPLWAEGFGSAGPEGGFSIAVTAVGEVFVVGNISQPIDFGGGLLTPPANGACFLLKLNNKGKHAWSQAIPGCTSPRVIVGGPSPDPVVVGIYGNGVTLGATTTPGAGAFAYKLKNDGTPLWSRPFPATSGLFEVKGLAVATNGDVAVSGGFTGKADFGMGMVTSPGEDIFLVKLAAGTGATLWAKNWSGGSGKLVHGEGVTFLSAAGDLALTGSISGSIDFGSGAVSTTAGMFLTKLDPNGVGTMARIFTAATGTGVVQDSTGALVVIGDVFSTQAAFDNFIVVKGGFLARFDGTLMAKYAKPLTGLTGGQVAIDSAGNLLVGGSITGSVDFGQPVTTYGSTDMYLGKFVAATGAHTWSRHYGSSTADGVAAVAVDPTKTVFFTGSFSDGADFGVGTLPAVGETDVVVGRFSP